MILAKPDANWRELWMLACCWCSVSDCMAPFLVEKINQRRRSSHLGRNSAVPGRTGHASRLRVFRTVGLRDGGTAAPSPAAVMASTSLPPLVQKPALACFAGNSSFAAAVE